MIDVHGHVLDKEAIISSQSSSFEFFSRETIEPVEEKVKLDHFCVVMRANQYVTLKVEGALERTLVERKVE